MPGLTDQQRRSFSERGYLAVGRVSAPEHARMLKEVAGRLLGLDGKPPSLPETHLLRATGADPHVRVALHLCHMNPAFRLNATSARVAGLVADLFGEEPAALTSLLFHKPPTVGLELGLHQDLPYYPYLGDQQLITCWTALDPVDATNGGVQYVPGSHRGRLPHRQTGQQQALDLPEDLVDASAAHTVALTPGEAVLHHGLTVHRSAANTSDLPRMGLATLYIPAGVSVHQDDFPYPPLTPRSR
ncbi:hypothetical protein GCM10010124_29220 [Pilimelia terevasa]|uniref:Phytanoyl-CoA dioxygenase n=1 Tax=Pilimelia terevasa TaxID=53372 RepID=A0A8J3BQ08_9ACTN|nr:phytanoyl-CoA dioxygenase family protein [Pilimelia terevasa]GGK34733.1 hypothetical protein GCM10010124_29220 [Pilimelia terevasa]